MLIVRYSRLQQVINTFELETGLSLVPFAVDGSDSDELVLC